MEDLYNNTILIVDDTPENIDILVELLEGFDNQIAINGEDALETAWEGDPPDLILLDIKLPDNDGFAICYALKLSQNTKVGSHAMMAHLSPPSCIRRAPQPIPPAA